MASPVVADPGVADQNIDASADARFAEIQARLVAEPAPQAQPETPAVPAPVPPVQAQPAVAPSAEATPPVAPASPAPAAAVITIDPNSLSPERRLAFDNALAKSGGDPVKVAEMMWEFNNRLAALSTAPQPAQPAAPAQPVAPPPPVQSVEERIEAELADVIMQDSQVASLRAEHSAIIENIRNLTDPVGVKFEGPAGAAKAVNSALSRLERDVDRFQFRLSEPDVKEDDEKRADYERRLNQAERSISGLERQRGKLEAVEERYLRRRGAIQSSISDRLYQEHVAIQADKEAQQERESYTQEFGATFKATVGNVATQVGIDPELSAKFLDYAKTKTLLAANKDMVDLSRGGLPRLPTFLTTVAQEYLKDAEETARILAQIAARKAAGVNGTPPVIIPDATRVPVPQNGAPANGQGAQPQRSTDIDEDADSRVATMLQAMIRS